MVKKINTKLITLFIIVLGIIVFAIVWSAETSSGFYYERLDDTEYVWTSMVPYFGSITFLPFLALALIFYFWTSKMNVVVTNKRVYGISVFGRRIDLTLDKVSAVSTSFLKGIGVTTSSGIVKFRLFKNNIEIHSRINELLIKRQSIMEQNNEKTVVTNSAVDELKKWKELLDNETITQEEFDRKKRELLNIQN